MMRLEHKIHLMPKPEYKVMAAEPILLPGVTTYRDVPVYGIIQEVNGMYIIGLVENNEKPIGTIILGKSDFALQTYEASTIRIEGSINKTVGAMMSEIWYDSFALYNLPFPDESEKEKIENLYRLLSTTLVDMSMMVAQELKTPRVEMVHMMDDQRDWIKQSGYLILEDISTDNGADLTLISVHSC